MSTVTCPLDWDPTDPDARYQFALAVGEKATEITGPDDNGEFVVSVKGLGEERLHDALDSFTPDPQTKAPNPPRQVESPIAVTTPDGTTFLIDPAVLIRKE